MRENQNLILTVSQANRYVKSLLDGDARLKDVLIRGEISNYSDHYRSGHAYFTLKDDSSAVKAAFFRSYRERLPFQPQDGMRVIVRGQISLYERDGTYQLYVWEIQPDGVGALHLAFEQLKNRLAGEGLFESSAKKTLPPFPETIGVITSPTGAVVQDICNVIGRRFPCVQLRLYPVSVQGASAAGEIYSALRQADLEGLCDLIIIARGGGSLEDLWPFNDERLARAIFSAKTPIISAVGHETDFTIADFVADLRAPTPSAAAELAVPDGARLRQSVQNFRNTVEHSMTQRVLQADAQIEQFSQNLKSQLNNLLEHKQERASLLSEKVAAAGSAFLEPKLNRLAVTAGKLSALNPMNVLARGYSVTMHRKKICLSIASLAAGENITTIFQDGTAISKVTQVQADVSAEKSEARL
jgi:exodeoxyribonuclease VII large subunit